MSVPELTPERLVLHVESAQAGQRLDVFLAARLARHSRVQLRRAISAECVTVDGRRAKVAYRLRAGQRVEVIVPALPREGPLPEDIPLDVLYEDEHLIAINKAAGMVVHPARGHWSGTLASALSHHFQRLSTVGGPTRPGIVHRLDRETSGVILVAKTDQVHLSLAAQFENRSVQKEYFAIVQGVPERDCDVINRPIGPHPTCREKMAICPDHPGSRQAETMYEVMERFDRFAALRILPRTGRTHQVRVHLAYMGCPVLCDRLYAGRSQITQGQLRGQGDSGPVLLDRVALHAWRLQITHPVSGDPLVLAAPIPDDIRAVLAELRGSRRGQLGSGRD